jgi:Ca2+-binding RTX toxin-like protein
MGCQELPRDDGQIWSCFGLITEDVAGGAEVDTNLYFGGCSPADPGLQIVTYARPTATEEEIIAACDTGCSDAFSRYWSDHPDVALPLHCRTAFVYACTDPGLGADTSRLPANSNVGFFSGGPADFRSALTGNITLRVDGAEATVAASGVIDSTYAPCEGAGQSCDIVLSRFDAVADENFLLGGVSVELAQVQMQGLSSGRQSAGEFLIPAGAMNVEGNFSINGERSSLHATNDQMLKSIDQPRANYDFDITFGQGERTVRVDMTGSVTGSPPVAGFTPNGGDFECACKNCTTVTLTSTTQDEDLQNLSWVVDDQVAAWFDTTLPLQLPVGAHDVRLVATDTRGSATSASAVVNVVDTTPPVLTLPPNVSLRSCDYPEIGRATAVDACSQAFITNNDPGDFQVGVTNVTWRAEDEAGNFAEGIQRVSVTAVPDVNCCPAGYNIILGSGGSDNLVGTAGNDCILGFDGDDVIDGRGGNDYIVGGSAQDRLKGGAGDDVILGGDGDDIIDGGDGVNRVSGGTGQDNISAGAGVDRLRGGRGDDTIVAGDGDDQVIGGEGQDVITGGPGNDLLEGGLGGDNQKLFGGPGSDLLSGGTTRDRLEGNDGDDVLIGVSGDDVLDGGPGNDVLAAGSGHNQCILGGGIDQPLLCEIIQ